MIFDFLSAGLDVFLSPLALALTFTGIIIGLVVGALPGLGPLMGIILLLPVAIGLPPVAAMGFLIAIFVGGSCGGSISAILLRIPGTPLAAATLYDGYPMAQKGRASDAIGIAITASAIGGLIGGVVLVFCAPILASFASNFAQPEYAMLAVVVVVVVVVVRVCELKHLLSPQTHRCNAAGGLHTHTLHFIPPLLYVLILYLTRTLSLFFFSLFFFLFLLLTGAKRFEFPK